VMLSFQRMWSLSAQSYLWLWFQFCRHY